MTKYEQRKIALIRKRLRTLTVGMTIETWESRVSHTDPETGKPVYHATARFANGIDMPVAMFRSATKIKRHWVVRIKAAYFNPDKKRHEEKWSEFDVENVALDDLTPIYHEHRQPTIDMCNPKHFYDIGWWAQALD